LGVWSIGLFYRPVVLLSAIAAGLAVWRTRLPFVKALAAFAAGGAAQIVMMLAILRRLPSLTILASAIGTRRPTCLVRA
jgi:hypothetical protein